MIWLYMHLVIAALIVLIAICGDIKALRKFKKRYPDLTPAKKPFDETIFGWVRLVLFSLMPIFNIIMYLVALFQYDELVEDAYNNLVKDAENEIIDEGT